MEAMIRVNMQIKGNDNFEFDYENFPRLFSPFDKTRRITDTSIVFDRDYVDIQTILSDVNQLQKKTEKWIEEQETKLKAQLADIQHKLEILKAVKG